MAHRQCYCGNYIGVNKHGWCYACIDGYRGEDEPVEGSTEEATDEPRT